MDRRTFLGVASGVILAKALAPAAAHAGEASGQGNSIKPLKPMELGLMVDPYGDSEATIRRVHDLGFSNCFLSLDEYLNRFTPSMADKLNTLLAKYEVIATTVEMVAPEPMVWNFARGPATIGLVPPSTRPVRIDALRQASDFAKLLGVPQVQTHCGFIPEDPGDALYEGTVEAVRTVAQHCQGNGQHFLMETGQETPTAMSRVIHDVALPNLAVGLDTANLILYGKANPVDAVDILGPHIRSVHAKDGRWPTNPADLGAEVLIGKGLVDFKQVFTKLHRLGYTGAVTIERETSGPQQIEDVKQEKAYLEGVLREVMG
jgi:sugar phosphate isomerase/epimerase